MVRMDLMTDYLSQNLIGLKKFIESILLLVQTALKPIPLVQTKLNLMNMALALKQSN